MKNNKSLTIIVTVAVVVFLGLIFSVYKIMSNKQDKFYAAGYVSIADSENSNKLYFDEGTSYKNGYNEEIIFKDTDNEKVEASKYSFAFFNNKSIEFLTDGVILDLNGLSDNFIPYYNIKSKYIVEYSSDKYLIRSNEKDVILDNFIGRINDQKYIVAGNNIKLKLSNNDNLISSYYFELNFIDGNTVKIDGEEINLETISDNSYILVGDNIKIDLSKKIILYNDEEKVNLNEIIIDNDTNIDIAYDDSTYTISDDNKQSTNTNQEITNTNISNNNVNVINKSETTEKETSNYAESINEKYEVETITNYKNIPYLELLSSSAGTHSITLNFNVIDDSKLITGPITVKYTSIDDEDGKVYSQEFTSSQDTYKFVADNLVSNTKYVITVSASYIRNGNLFADYTLFQRTIETKDLGIELNEDYLTSNSITYNVISAEDASYDSAYLKVYDKEGTLVKSELITNNHSIQNITVNDLDSNSKYTATIEDLSYGIVKYVGTAISRTDTTLKFNPFKDSLYENNPTVTVNKKDNSFTISLGSVNDIDNAIKSVKYQIVDATDNSIIKEFNREYTDSVEVKFESPLETKKNYFVKTIVTLNDNEKIIDYELLDSNIFSLNNRQIPTMNFISSLVSSSTVNGTVKIYDPDSALDLSKAVYVEYTSALGDSGTLELSASHDNCTTEELTTTKCASVNINSLNSDDVYTFKVIGYINLDDETIEPGNDLIGTFRVKTSEAIIVNSNMEWQNLLTSDLTDEERSEVLQKLLDELFEVNIGLSMDLTDENNVAIMKQMDYFEIYLYEGTDTTGLSIGNPIIVDKDIANTYFDQRSIAGENNYKTITLKDFGLDYSDLQAFHIDNNTALSQNYTILLTKGKAGTNDIEFQPKTYSFTINQELLQFSEFNPEVELKIVDKATECEVNAEATICSDDTINDTTAAAVTVTSSFNLRQYAEEIVYTFYDITNPSDIKTYTYTEKLDTSEDIPSKTFMISNIDDTSDDAFFKRGRIYYATMKVGLNLDHDKEGKIEFYYPINEKGETIPETSNTITIEKQKPSLEFFRYNADYSDNSMEIKYQITDVDNTLIKDDNIYYNINENTEEFISTKAECTSYENYKCTVINNLNAGDTYLVYLKPYLVENFTCESTRVDSSSYLFEGKVENLNADYTLNNNNANTLEIVLNDNDSGDLNRVASYSVTLNYGENNLVIGNIIRDYSSNTVAYPTFTYNSNKISYSSNSSLTNAAIYRSCYNDENKKCIYIDYSVLYNSSELSEFKASKGQTINVSISALYDTGKIEYAASSRNKYAFQVSYPVNSISAKTDDNKYIVIKSSSNIIHKELSAVGAAYSYANDPTGEAKTYRGFVDDNAVYKDQFTLKNSLLNNVVIYPKYTYSTDGVILDSSPVVAKLLGNTSIGDIKTFTYNAVHPSVNLNINFTSTVDGFNSQVKISGNNDSDNGTSSFFEIYSDSKLVGSAIEIPNKYLKGEVLELSLDDNKYSFGSFADNKYYLNILSIKDSKNNKITNYYYDYKTGILSVPGYDTVRISYSIGIGSLNNNETYTVKVRDINGTYYTNSLTDNDPVTLEYNEVAKEFTTRNIADSTLVSSPTFTRENFNYKYREITYSYVIDDIVGLNNLSYEFAYTDASSNLVGYTQNVIALTDADKANCNFVLSNTCFIKNSNGTYTGYYKFKVNDNDSKFVYGTTYQVTLTDTTKNNSLYALNGEVTALKEPTFTVPRSNAVTSKDNENYYTLIYNLNVYDEDEVIIDGTLTYSLKEYDTNGELVIVNKTSSEFATMIEQLQENSANEEKLIGTYSKSINYPQDSLAKLEPNQDYYLSIDYKVFMNNLNDEQTDGKTKNKRIINYTLSSEGVSEGQVEFFPKYNADTTIKFSYATGFSKPESGENTVQVVGIDYTINEIDSGGEYQPINGMIIYDNDYTCPTVDSSDSNPKRCITAASIPYTESESKDSYAYTMNLGVINYPKIGAGYLMRYNFYLYYSNAEKNTYEACDADNTSNIWLAKTNKCYYYSKNSTPSSPIYGSLGGKA